MNKKKRNKTHHVAKAACSDFILLRLVIGPREKQRAHAKKRVRNLQAVWEVGSAEEWEEGWAGVLI